MEKKTWNNRCMRSLRNKFSNSLIKLGKMFAHREPDVTLDTFYSFQQCFLKLLASYFATLCGALMCFLMQIYRQFGQEKPTVPKGIIEVPKLLCTLFMKKFQQRFQQLFLEYFRPKSLKYLFWLLVEKNCKNFEEYS